MQCKHERSEPRLRTKTNGAIVVSLQCLNCGTSRGELKKSEFNLSQLLPYDDLIREKLIEEQRRDFESRRNQSDLEHQQKTSEWWEHYKFYLKSDHWRAVRQRVLSRDGICQVCFDSSATQAHHLTYASFSKWGMSFPVECVGICDKCHDRLHDISNEEAA